MMAWIRSLVVVRYFVLASIFFLSALALNGNAQTFRGTILGTVTDSSGAAISGATVTVKNTGTGFVRTVTTDDDGNYSAPELARNFCKSQTVWWRAHLRLLGQVSEWKSAFGNGSFNGHLSPTGESASIRMPSHEEKVKDKHGQSESVVILVPLKRAKRAVLKVRLCVSWNTYFTKRTRNHIYYS
jgi:Carboxypeptidase regulatory-like domain